MALYKKTEQQQIPQIIIQQVETQPKPAKKRKYVKDKKVAFLVPEVSHVETPVMTQRERLFAQMFPGRNPQYCM